MPVTDRGNFNAVDKGTDSPFYALSANNGHCPRSAVRKSSSLGVMVVVGFESFDEQPPFSGINDVFPCDYRSVMLVLGRELLYSLFVRRVILSSCPENGLSLVNETRSKREKKNKVNRVYGTYSASKFVRVNTRRTLGRVASDND